MTGNRFVVVPILGVLAATAGAAPISEELVVTARRVDESLMEVPAAVSLVTRETLQRGRQQLGLDESLNRVPGLFFQNRYNFAQDLRISMRGFGARADFGIRGVKIVIDEIPATLPDGQGGVDGIDIGSIERVEILRGPSSALYGTAAGGVIKLETERGEEPFVEAGTIIGEDDSQRFSLKAGGGGGPWQYFASVSDTSVDGYRGHNENEATNFNANLSYAFDDSLRVSAVFGGVHSPIANDPGGLTAAEVEADRTQGRARNIELDAGESVDQYRLGVVVEKQINEAHQWRLRAFGLTQDFETRIPNVGTVAASNGGWVEFDRAYYGTSGEYTYSSEIARLSNRLTLGFEVARQDDDRVRYVNDNGQRGALTFDQNETVDTLGFFLQNETFLTEAVSLTVGARFDSVQFKVDDHFLLNTSSDDSGKRSFDEFSPTVGLLWVPQSWLALYGNVATSFETPTTTEFANPGGGGFNPDLGPQTSTNYEIGAKGIIDGRLMYDLALFRIDTSNELLVFEVPGDERAFFENAGASDRFGFEGMLTAELLPGLDVTVAYTYSDFTFDRFRTGADVFDGNHLPGLPKHQTYAELAYSHPEGFYATWDILAVGGLFADNANAQRISGYEVSNLHAGYEWRVDGWSIEPFVGINNLFDTKYTGNVRVNAFGGRFYEPAPDRNIFGGLSIRYDWN